MEADTSGGGSSLPGPAACEGVVSRTGVPASGGTGRLRIALTQAAASGARYRLEGATFSLYRTGDGAEYPGVLRAGDSADGDVLEVALPAGEYVLGLNDGWSVAALGGGAPSSVPAARLSSRQLGVYVEGGAEVSVRFRFEVEMAGAELAPAELAPTLGVLERPAPLSGRVCVESAIAPEGYWVFSSSDLDALEGCSEIRGELFLGLEGPLALSPLSRLQRVCGSLSLSSTASFGPEPPAEQSLAGLEALEEVDALVIAHPGVSSLTPLAKLRRIQRRDVENDVLGLDLIASSLEDLSGLEHVSEIQSVRVDGGDALRSLRGLLLPGEMRAVMVSGTNLADLSALAGIERLSESLYIGAGAVIDLNALSNLRSADAISISTTALRDATGLAGLETTNYFSLQDSPLEVPLPVFAALTRVGELNLSGVFAPGVLSMPALASASKIYMERNARLEGLSLPALTGVGTLTLRDNAALVSLDLPALSSATGISIVKNPALAADQFARLETLDVSALKIGGNAGSSLPLDPCPWQGDAVCDATFDGVCAPGSDGNDCGPID